MGGTLAQPVKNYPSYFLPGSFFDKYPYLLPNLVCTAVVIFGLVVGVLFLEETHEDKKDRKDIGLEMGRRVLNLVNLRRENGCLGAHIDYFEETRIFLGEENRAADFALEERSARAGMTSTDASSKETYSGTASGSVERTSSVWQAFTAQMLLLIVGYGLLAL